MATYNVWVTVGFKVFHEDAIEPNVEKLRDVLIENGFLHDTIEWEHEEAGEADL